MQPGILVRLQAARVLLEVTRNYRQLDDAIDMHREGVNKQDQALLQAICYGVMRWYLQLLFWMEHHAGRPAEDLKPAVRALILIGLYQLKYMRIPPHAAIHSTVECASHLQSKRAKGLINAVLRGFQRSLHDGQAEQRRLLQGQTEAIQYAHPNWMLQQFRTDWPQDWLEIVEHNNQQAPMVLRLDPHRLTVKDYLSQLEVEGLEASQHRVVPHAVVLNSPVDVKQLPGFDLGAVSVQDAAAQLAVPLLDHKQNHRVLDACAAPGGKTAHILQQTRPESLVAVDNDARRLQRVADTLTRIDQSATLIEGDAGNPDAWWDGKPFDRILLDAPCSASGVIRRHPDIKYLRTEKALQKAIKRQAKILDAVWQLLRPGGMLVYVTCSVFKAENQHQVARFMADRDDVELVEMQVDWGRGNIGRQVLPGEDGMDGFYFAQLLKR